MQFNRDVRPILSNNCFLCHGPDANKRQSGLRLDIREAAIEKGAIVPGNVAESKLVARIGHEQEMLRMPPAYSNKSLSESQKQTLINWIEQGAPYQGHWAYTPPVRPAAPSGSAAIDHFVTQRLREEGLVPVGRAGKRQLARRLSLDLTGLPPDAELVERYAKNEDQQAYEKLVDQLLASPHFGERMAVSWLDLVRYADTTGFHNDVPFNVYPYRDYVIAAFNGNKPFDQFTREQLGGDLMPNPTDEQLVASAYNRLNRLTTEGGAQAKEYLAKYASDRVSTTATVWLGSTLGCAECHDHKFDPFLTKEFYQIGAFFADIEEVGVFPRDGNYGPRHRILRDNDREEAARIEARLEKLRLDGKGLLPDKGANRRAVKDYLKTAAGSWTPLEPTKVWDDCSDPDIEGCEGLELEIKKEGLVQTRIVGDEKPRESVQVFEIPLRGQTMSALLVEILPSKGFDEFYLSRIRAQIRGRGEYALNLLFRDLVPDQENEEEGSLLRDTLEDNPQSGWAGKPSKEGVRRAMYVLEQPLEAEPTDTLVVTLTYNGRAARAVAGLTRLSATEVDFPELPGKGDRFNEITAGNSNWQEIRRLDRSLRSLWDRADECHIAHAVDEPREMRILPRGDWMNEAGEVVRPQTPAFLGEIPEDGRRLNRLDLGTWLASAENPLTARVFVNRMWRMFFGVGLSKSLGDMGSQGEPPVHPELLDWLAVEFVESGWDVKHLLRTMLLSDAYQRSSEPSPALLEKDPYNRLYGRQAMLRIDAEFVRDSALKISGLLNTQMGGPSVKPYQPKGYYAELNFPKREYEPDYDANQFRRGVYTHWQRTFLQPSLMAFDAPAREECTPERAVSNTPLQSLALLNDPSYVEAARAFAARMLPASSDDAKRIDFAFQTAFSRSASDEERTALLELLESQRQRFRAAPERAAELLVIGITPLPSSADKPELAAWTMVARAMLNKHEFLMRY
ncbi:MAG: PSD1 and planctomycete cytochrome C domain-containing protein [Acidobacteria bacterium]|nr:PSD1 and planctomycete cytochrome C domain-containing protein [Acidobacteriota bacterium]MDA1233654.1 PSD1 and planctomycete cytochrome C domain-containing protein [Acidobacteriota bacterium]